MSKAKIEFFFDGDEYFQNIFKEIDRAQEEILVEFYIFNMDRLGLQFLEKLAKARARGVRVKILTDGVGSFTWRRELKKYCRKNNLAFRVYRPFPTPMRWFFQTSRKFWDRVGGFFTYMNRRDHRKLVVIDKQVAFVGSFNVSEVHSQKFVGKSAWRDSGAKITETDLHPVIQTFHKIYFRKPEISLRLPKKTSSAVFRYSSNWRERLSNKRELKKKILNAQSRILLTTPYFIPSQSFAKVLRKAAERGVYVGLCLPEQTDVPIVKIASERLFPKLLKAGVHIHEYRASILHAKTTIIDDWAALGSHNLNHRSFFHDHELELQTTEPEYLNQLLKQWDKDIANSQVITWKHFKNKSIFKKMLSWFFFQFRYWL